jgi:hypothetical protein
MELPPVGSLTFLGFRFLTFKLGLNIGLTF